MGITIDNESIDNSPWGDVDKTALKYKLAKAVKDGVEGAEAAIREVYAIVGSIDDPRSWKLPHYSLSGDTVRLNRAGVYAATARLDAQDITAEQKQSASKQILSRYKQLNEDVPDSLGGESKSFDYTQIKEVVATKKLNLKVLDDGTILKTMYLGVPETVGVAVDDTDTEEVVYRSKAVGSVTDEMSDLEKFNKYSGALEPQSADSVKLYKFYSAGQQVDLQNDKFLDQGLQDMASLDKGKPILEDHQWNTKNTVGCIYDSYVINRSGQKMLVQKVGVLNIPSTQELIKKVDGGAIKYVSVGFAVDPEKYTCSSCKQPILSMACKHRPGMSDEKGNKVVACIGGVKNYFETSFTPVPAQSNTKISKSTEQPDVVLPEPVAETSITEEVVAAGDNSNNSKSLDNINLGNTGVTIVSDNKPTQPATEPTTPEQKPSEQPAAEIKGMSLEEIVKHLNDESVEDADTKDRSVILSGETLKRVLVGIESSKVAPAADPATGEAKVEVVELKSVQEFTTKTSAQVEQLTQLVKDLATKLEETSEQLAKTAELQKAQTALLSKAMTKPQTTVDEALVKELRAQEPNTHWIKKHAAQVGVQVGG